MELIDQVFDSFPLPLEVFALDGTTVFINHAFLDLYGIQNPDTFVGRYNIFSDLVCIDRIDVKEKIEKVFNGETVSILDFKLPIQHLIDIGIIKEKPFESAISDLTFSPIQNKGKIAFILCVYIVKNIYRGLPNLVRVKEYMETHWKKDYDPKVLAKSMNMSVAQLYKLFKQNIGMTPGDYHKKIKVEHIKEKLTDKNLSIKQVFIACGEDSRGWFATVFKRTTGLSPTQWREQYSKTAEKDNF